SEVTNAAIYINGHDTGLVTPANVSGLTAGSHKIAFRLDGYMTPPLLYLPIVGGQNTAYSTTLRMADRDYDSVNDGQEVDSYNTIFGYAAADDPDGDGVSNFLESEQFRLHGIRLNLTSMDTDGDGMTDGQEFAYDGNSNALAVSVLSLDCPVRASQVRVRFIGSYLAGVSYLQPTGFLSIDGDKFETTGMSWTLDALGEPVMVYNVDVLGSDDEIVNESHGIGDTVIGDGIPDDTDTDDDGMWDGYEFAYESVDGIDVLDNNGADDDPDLDGLSNLREFLGVDNLPSGNSNSWSNPNLADSDGDGIPDGWEYEYQLDPLNPADALYDEDLDGPDGLNNYQEWVNRTDPYASDSDNDFVIDGAEVNVYGTDPLSYDTDLDGLWDGQEVIDTDLDRSNGEDRGFFPNWLGNDFDADGFVDGPTDWDTDGDGMPDGYEVLEAFLDTNGMQIIRQSNVSLDPMDPLDGVADEDGDGLSNLEEYLVRDNLIGINPGGLLWDYPSDPFDPDTDSDGMPDGWEVWRGLHPQDPIPNPRTTTQWSIRNPNFWRYGDLDDDGLENIDEYEMRFVFDPNIDRYAIAGSADPWRPDTDSDGILDGDELKVYRSNPSVQDTDGDGLIDGIDPMGLRQGEVNSSVNIFAQGHYDRALNDLWRLGQGWVYNPLTDGHYIGYTTILPDSAPQILPVYTENPVGHFAIDITNAPMVDSWITSVTAPLPPSGPLGYEWNADIQKNPALPGFNDNPGGGQGLLSFLLNVTVAGTYNIRLYNCVQSLADDDDTVWMSIDMGPWTPVTPNGPAGTWSWNTQNDNTGLDMSQFFNVGVHRIFISGRGEDFGVTRLLVYENTLFTPSAVEIAPAGQITITPDPVQTAFWSIPDRPNRRWGGNAATFNATIRDDAQGTFVGRPISGRGATRQVLLQQSHFTIFGGRNGGRFFNGIWAFKGNTTWIQDPIAGFIDPLPAATAGRSGMSIVALSQVCPNGIEGGANWASGNNPQNHFIRPRPGSAPGYLYYDGDRDTDPIAIWGEEGQESIMPIGYFLGSDNSADWDGDGSADYVYYPWGHNSKEAVTKWDLPWSTDFIPFYLPDDDFTQATYTWSGGETAYQYTTNDVSAAAPNEYISHGALLDYDNTVPGLTNISIVGMQIDNVLNTINSSAAGTLFSSLNLVYGNTTNSNPMQVQIFGEISLRDIPSVPNPSVHPHWTSNPDYGPNLNNAAGDDFTPLRRDQLANGDSFLPLQEAYHKTPPITVTLPVQSQGSVVAINVTGIMSNLLGHTSVSGGDTLRWDMGGQVGFVIKPVGNAGRDTLNIADSYLTMVATAPFWEWPAAAGYWVGSDYLLPQYTPAQYYLNSTLTGDINTFYPFPRTFAGLTQMGTAGFLLFGGIDGNDVLDDTWISTGGLTQDAELTASAVIWTYLEPTTKPIGRWAPGLAAGGAGAVLFGGFDVNNEPLNDTWYWSPAQQNWYPVTNFANNLSGVYHKDYDLPRPRGGAFFTSIGMPTLFGGTDGEFYFNDGWVLEVGADPATSDLNDPAVDPWRWILSNPYGERSGAPPARAFPLYAPGSGMMFGGRTGALPTSKDTDNDWVDDGIEHSLGGPNAGRDPRVNALMERNSSGMVTDWGYTLSTNAPETIPYAFYRMGGYSYEDFFYTPNGWGNIYPRGAVADFESLSHPHELNQGDVGWANIRGPAVFNTPVEGGRKPTPTISGFVMNTGFDAVQADHTNLWWRPYDGAGGWELGSPQSGSPQIARSGRWCYGTDMDGYYGNDKVEELYSPLVHLSLPVPLALTTTNNNNNGFWLVFHEWLDLADSGDNVRIEAIRPTTQADIRTRVSGVGKDPITILPDRNDSYNTTTEGKWRRVAVSLDPIGNEQNIFLKFVLESDSAGRSHGWFIDDVAILQAGDISGIVAPGGGGATVYLFGASSIYGSSNVVNDPILTTTANGSGGFGFAGLIPAGNYKIMSDTGSVTTNNVGISGSWSVTGVNVNSIDEIIVGITVNSPALLTWNSIPGVQYLIMYATPESLATANPWNTLTVVTASDRFAVYRDDDSDGERSRYYKIISID
ncbi:hypothetical protein BVX97_04580, partial [bacterium E08(2017)]